MTFNYASGIYNDISRLSSISDSGGTLESYTYMGLGTVVTRAHPLPTSPASSLDLTYQTASTGDAGDYVGGLDRFGRVVDQNWTKGGTDKDRYGYTYDRNSNRLTKTNAVSSAFNEAYTYDGLSQISTFNRDSGAHTQAWNNDGLCNWDSITTDGGSPQTRTHNAQNKITAVSGATSPTFDANGNMTTDETNKKFVYDAWNRLVQVKNSSSAVIATYTYDALTRRVTEYDNTTTKHLYYSAGWQVLEERLNSNTYADVQYVWSPVYIDAMILRDRDSDHDGSHTLDERLYVAQDANFNVTALINTSGTVVERFAYDAFGAATVYDASYTLKGSGSDYAWIYQFQCGRYNSLINHVSFRRRELLITLGRWSSLDPISYEQPYVFCNNTPINQYDPMGLSPNAKYKLRLSSSIVQPGTCGDFYWDYEYKVTPEFKANPLDSNQQGMVVEKITFDYHMYDCDDKCIKPAGTVKALSTTVWRLIPIMDHEGIGKRTSYGVSGLSFLMKNGPGGGSSIGTKGEVGITVTAYFVYGRDINDFNKGITSSRKGFVTYDPEVDPKYGGDELGGPFGPSTSFDPGDSIVPGDSDIVSDTISFSIQVKWDCCSGILGQTTLSP